MTLEFTDLRLSTVPEGWTILATQPPVLNSTLTLVLYVAQKTLPPPPEDPDADPEIRTCPVANDRLGPEFGSVEDRSRPRRKARWFKHIKRTFKRHRYRQFAGLFYFHARSTDDGVCNWRVDSSRRSLRAFRGLTGDRFYRSG